MRNIVEALALTRKGEGKITPQLGDSVSPFDSSSATVTVTRLEEFIPPTRAKYELAETKHILKTALVANLGSHNPAEANGNLLNGQVRKEAVRTSVAVEIDPTTTLQAPTVPDHIKVSDFFNKYGKAGGLHRLGKDGSTATRPDTLRYENGPTLRFFPKIEIVSFVASKHVKTVHDGAIRINKEGKNGVYTKYDIISPVTIDPRDGSGSVSVISVDNKDATVRRIPVNDETEAKIVEIAYALGTKAELLTDTAEEKDLTIQVQKGDKVFRKDTDPYQPGDQSGTREETYPNGW